MLFLIFLILSVYFILILMFFWGWIKLPVYTLQLKKATLKVSILIPFRDEAANLPYILQSLSNQDYPPDLIEIIFINDHSKDNGLDLISNYNLKNIQIVSLDETETGKKTALARGFEIATGQLIFTTDADCLLPKTWINTIVGYYIENKPKLIAGPVMYYKHSTLWDKFQILEFLSLQGTTGGAISVKKPVMCNGANLIYPREIYNLVMETYQENKTFSGDDIFLLQKVNRRYPGEVKYIKSPLALVLTNNSKSLVSFIQQRKRWTSKARFYTDIFTLLTAFTVLATNILLFVSFLYALTKNNWFYFSLIFWIKTIADFPLMFVTARFFKLNRILIWFPVVQCFYFLYVTITFVSAVFGRYTWKSRKLRT